MAWSLSGSVGRYGHNLPADVLTVQQLLTRAAARTRDPRLDPGRIDGVLVSPPSRCPTVAAILAFQQGFLRAPDGRIDVGGRTWNRLVEASADAPSPSVTSTMGLSFPFPALPSAKWRWSVGQRAFGATRSGGARAHAGCDLYYPVGTWIHAMADGEVVVAPSAFYARTDALAIDHGSYLVRYCEVQPGLTLPRGTLVRAEQPIAQVGRLHNIRVPSAMLHLEVYDKSASGDLTVHDRQRSARRPDGVPYFRRRDLVDPTPFLDAGAAHRPPAA
jgi:murein DD-endopeptidase MepM/ murein hydrolase activator NlpD